MNLMREEDLKGKWRNKEEKKEKLRK